MKLCNSFERRRAQVAWHKPVEEDGARRAAHEKLVLPPAQVAQRLRRKVTDGRLKKEKQKESKASNRRRRAQNSTKQSKAE